MRNRCGRALFIIVVEHGVATKHQRGDKLVIVGLMLWLWLATSALAASDNLHCLLHQDAHSVSHHCLVTHLQQHSLLLGGGQTVVLADAPLIVEPYRYEIVPLLPVHDYRLAPSRAPPFVFSSARVAG